MSADLEELAMLRAMSALRLPGRHVRVGDMLNPAPWCALWGCSAFASNYVCIAERTWTWLCFEHVFAALRSNMLWPNPPC